MSSHHVNRLRAVEAEMEAMDKAAKYIIAHWDEQNIGAEITGVGPNHVKQAQKNNETTYFVRLYAEFEGLLKDHLATNHPAVSLPRKPKIDDVIAAVVKAENLAIEPPLRARLNSVRDFRNSIAHSARSFTAPVLFADARRALNTFVAKLPAPRL